MKVQDSEILSDFSDIFREEPDVSRIVRESTWFRNILFYLGEQWISWFEDQQIFGATFRFNTNEPTPVANFIRDHVKAMKALIMNKKYAARIWPNSEEQRDKDAAELGVKVLDWLDSLQCHEIEDIKEEIALWTLLTGVGFARTYASLDNGKYVKNKDGKIISIGDVAVESPIPFNLYVPLVGNRLREKSYVGVKCLKEREWIEDTFKVVLPEAAEGSGAAIEYERKLMTLVANVSSWKGQGVEGGDTSLGDDKLVLYKEVEYRPTRKHPEGRYAAVAGGKVLVNDDHLPIETTDDGEWEYTFTEFQYNHTPGSFWSTSGIDDLISPQVTINEIDQALSTNRKDLGRPFVLTPFDLIVRRRSAAGQNFVQVEYDGLLSGGKEPKVERGTPYPSQVLEERNINIQTIQSASGDPKNILRGQTPQKQASGVLVDILRESAELSHTPDIDRFYRSWNRVKKKQLLVVQSLYTETRLIKIPGRGNRVIVKSFKGSDLHNNTDVRLELDSGISSTKAGQNQFILDLIKSGFFGDMVEKPEMQYELMQRFGMSWMPVENDVHEKRADLENSLIASATDKEIKIEIDYGNPVPVLEGIFAVKKRPQTSEAGFKEWSIVQQGLPQDKADPNKAEVEIISPDPYFKYDDDQVHYRAHTRKILSSEFKEWSVAKQTILINHTDVHHARMQAAAASMLEGQQFQGQMQQIGAPRETQEEIPMRN